MPEPIVKRVAESELSGDARKLYEQFTSHDKPVPKWMQVMANCDDILVGFFAMFKATMDDAPLPSLLKWKVANAVSKLNKCEFCIDVANAQLRQFGLDDAAIEAVEEQADEREKVAIEFARAVTEKAYEIDPSITAKAKETFTDEELVELTAVIGLFNYINRFNDALGVMPG
ncbi:MAG: carboxymuconolactone decarboxylase family protein [Candidatus Kaiserbacteria bacterium]|nr:carboxymuconolactone decarboxylase family protein [Candidatus Kaiserbacteria bacterium]MCB9816112.1 carboxymuconolactone decarboxylase family protein [Candidatus Nomurabacteria bacterium]